MFNILKNYKMLAIKYFKIILSILFIIPFTTVAQNNEVQDYYITKNGEKTRIVEDALNLQNKKAQFLYDGANKIKRSTRYSRLTEAVRETEMISELIDTLQQYNWNAESLGYEQSRKNLELLRQEREVGSKSQNKNTSLEEMLFLKQKYGDKPSYFINGTEVSQQIANKIMDKDILSKEVLVQNTATGNPNGEIRYTVNQKTLVKLGFTEQDEYLAGVYQENYNELSQTMHLEQASIEAKLAEIKENDRILQHQMQEVEKLRKEIAEKKQNAARENQYTDRNTNRTAGNESTNYQQLSGNFPQEIKPRQERIYRYGENGQERTSRVKEKPKQDITDEEVFIISQADWKKTEDLDNKKRSIKEIKDKDRNR